MTTVTLYKYKSKHSTITSPKMPPEGVEYTTLTRIIADNGMGITDGNIICTCQDVNDDEVINWSDCELPPEPEPEEPEEPENENIEPIDNELEPPVDQMP